MFKIGDTVKIRDDLESLNLEELPGIIQLMFRDAGKADVIDCINSRGYITLKNIGCRWNKKWLIPYSNDSEVISFLENEAENVKA